MRYRRLGKTGFNVSEIGYGGWGIGGGWGHTDDEVSMESLKKSIDLGINFFDTALVYGRGHSERLIGEAVKSIREKVYIATKIPPKTFKWPVLPNEKIKDTFPADWIIKCTEESLKNIGTDYIDLQQLHAWTDSYTCEEEWYEAFMRLKKDGKVRAFGVSANDWEPYNTVNLVKTGLIDSVQVIYNIFEQRPEEKLFPAAIENDVGIIVRVPFEEGLLTGKIKPGHKFDKEDWRANWLTRERIEEAYARLKNLESFLDNETPTFSDLALKFCLSNSAVSTVIPGMRKIKHVEDNCAASNGILLSEEKLKQLKSCSFVHGWAYPWAQKIN